MQRKSEKTVGVKQDYSDMYCIWCVQEGALTKRGWMYSQHAKGMLRKYMAVGSSAKNNS